MAIESSIIFSIGSKSIGGFTELKSAIDLMGMLWGKIKDNIKELDQFSTMWQKTNQSAVLAADAAAGGLVDTTEVLRGFNKLAAAGVKVTEEQFKTLTARAADLAQQTGTDATDAFKRLTQAISTGSTRALKEYGINAKSGGDLTKMQTDAIKALTEGYEGFTAQAITTSEKMYVLENNIGTLRGLLYEATGASEAFDTALDALNTGLGTFNEYMAKAPEATLNFATSLEGLAGFAIEAARVIAEPFIQIERLINYIQGVSGKGTFEQSFDDFMKTPGDFQQDALDKFYVARGEEEEARKAAGVGSGEGITKRRGRRRGGGGRGGGGGGKKEDPEKARQAELDEFFGEPSTDIVSELSNEALAERISLVQEYTTAIEEKDEAERTAREEEKQAREALLELAKEEAEQQQEAREKEAEQANQLRETWTSTFDSITAGAQKQNKWVAALSKGMGASIDAAVKQEEHAGAAITNVLGEVGSALSEEAGWQILMEVAKAIAAAASQNYAAAAAHGAAAVAFGVAAAATGKGSGKGSSGSAVASQSQTQRFSGGNLNGAQNEQNRGGSQGFTVNIQMKEGAGGFFDALVDENDRASIDGRRNFAGGN